MIQAASNVVRKKPAGSQYASGIQFPWFERIIFYLFFW